MNIKKLKLKNESCNHIYCDNMATYEVEVAYPVNIWVCNNCLYEGFKKGIYVGGYRTNITNIHRMCA